MKITIFASGSRGDVQPYVALGVGLKNAGHTVRILTSQDFENLVSSSDLEFFDMGGSTKDVAQTMQDLLEEGNFLKILASMGNSAKSMIEAVTRNGLAACQDADLILGGLGGLFTGLAISEKLNIPFIQAYYYPFTPTRVFPNALVPLPNIQLPGWINKLSHQVAQQMFWMNFRGAENKARRSILEMKPAPFFGPFRKLQNQKQTILYGYSPQVLPAPEDWDEFVHVTGYWFLEQDAEWQPPIDLVNFLEAGTAPVYIGFGSMVNRNAQKTTDLVLKALEMTGQRGVLSAGWGGLNNEDLPENVFMIDSIPFTWLFPQMAAVVHHGGAGTTSIGLWAGRPSIVTPFMGDQPFWGQRVYELGVGPKPIPWKKLTADRLAEAIQIAVSDQEMREKAVRLGELIRIEDGIANAVALIERSLINS